MNLEIESRNGKTFDGRRHSYADIIDRDTEEKVGYMRARGVGFGNRGGITVSLFGDKYWEELNRYEERFGFIKGVEAVLKYTQRHLTSTEYPPAKDDAA
jgi:hypothetical protein